MPIPWYFNNVQGLAFTENLIKTCSIVIRYVICTSGIIVKLFETVEKKDDYEIIALLHESQIH